MSKPESELLALADVARIVGVSVSTLQSHRYPGKRRRQVPFPEPVHKFGKSPVWRRADIEEWAAKRAGVGRPTSRP